MGDEELDDIEVTIASSPLHGSGDEVAAQSVNFSALLEQITAGGYMCVNGRPMKRCDVLRITVCSSGFSR